jgi:hypothetical protein
LKNNLEAMVEQKLDAIKDTIQNAFFGGKIDYLGCGDTICKFQLFREGLPPCRLDFAWEYLLDHNEHVILDRLRKLNVFEILSNASKPMHILITETNVSEVNDRI